MASSALGASSQYVLGRLARRGGASQHRASQMLLPLHALRARRGVLGQTTPEERAYCHWYGRTIYSGAGAIVELGAWLGSLTGALAMGVSANKNAAARRHRIHAFDKFTWESWWDDRYARGTPLENTYRHGDSFVGEYERLMSPWEGLIAAHPGDLTATQWDGGPIEFLLVDAMKSWELADAIVRTFFGDLIPGRSLVLHQDFSHYYTPWIHLAQYRLRDSFELVYDIPRSSGAVFRLVRALEPERLAEPRSFDSFDAAEIDAAFEHSLGQVEPGKRSKVAAAKAMLFVHEDDPAQARVELDRFRAREFEFDADLAHVEALVAAREQGGEQVRD